MDLSGNYDTKRWGCSLFIVSVLVWLITITAVFQVTINHNAENVSGNDNSLKTVSDEMKNLKGGLGKHENSLKIVGDDMKKLKDGFGKHNNSLKTVDDDMKKLKDGLGKNENSLKTLGEDMKKLKDGLGKHENSLINISDDMKELKNDLGKHANEVKAMGDRMKELQNDLGNHANEVKAVGDGMKRLENGFGKLKILLKGGSCMGGACLCGSKDSTAIWYDSHRANVCNESAPSVACGQNAACEAYSKTPFCLDTTGVTSGHGVTPVFGKTNSSVTCQCNANYQCMDGPDTMTPFCGTGESSAAAQNRVDVGTCGKCQVLAAGGGDESQIIPAVGGGAGRGSGDLTSCGSGMVCCQSGKCATEHQSC